MSPAQLPLVVRDPFRGAEVLRAVQVPDGGYRILSVPILVAGLSRGTVVEARAGADHLVAEHVLLPSPGATVRCVVSNTCTLRRLCDEFLDPRSSEVAARLGLGPASLHEPDVVAVHVQHRAMLPKVTVYLDHLILLGVLLGWEPTDPGVPPDRTRVESEPIEYVHPPADDWTDPDDEPAAGPAS